MPRVRPAVLCPRYYLMCCQNSTYEYTIPTYIHTYNSYNIVVKDLFLLYINLPIRRCLYKVSTVFLNYIVIRKTYWVLVVGDDVGKLKFHELVTMRQTRYEHLYKY